MKGMIEMGEWAIKKVIYDGDIVFVIHKGCYADGEEKTYEVHVPSNGKPVLNQIGKERE